MKKRKKGAGGSSCELWHIFMIFFFPFPSPFSPCTWAHFSVFQWQANTRAACPQTKRLMNSNEPRMCALYDSWETMCRARSVNQTQRSFFSLSPYGVPPSSSSSSRLYTHTHTHQYLDDLLASICKHTERGKEMASFSSRARCKLHSANVISTLAYKTNDSNSLQHQLLFFFFFYI